MNIVLNLYKRILKSQTGIISPLILIGVVSVLVLFVIFGTLPIKDKLLGGLFQKQSSHASGASVNLNLLPANTTIAPNTTFNVDVVIGPQLAAVSGVEADITFDPTKLQATNIVIGTALAQPLDPCTFQLGVCTKPFTDAIKYTDASKTTQTGTIHFSAGAKTGDPFVTTPARIATITFKSLAVTTVPSQITVNSSATSIAGADPANGEAITGDLKAELTNSIVAISNSPSVTKTANFSLTAPASATTGNQFSVVVKSKSPEAANLFAANLNFDPNLLEVVSISTAGSFVTQWVNDNSFDNTSGWISLIGGVPTPGFTSSTNATMATITFKTKTAGQSAISFAADSAIYRNSDNANILITPVTGSVIDVAGTTASPSPSAAASSSPIPVVSASPSSAASASPSPLASASTVASASPSPTGSSNICTLASADWITSTNPVNEGQVVGLKVVGNSACEGQNIAFTVFEDDSPFSGTDGVEHNPPATKFNSNGTATSNWLAEYQDDPAFVNNNIPEYYFVAQLTSGQSITSSDPELQVNKLEGGAFLTGDVNKDGLVDRVDLSILLSNWNKKSDFVDSLDLNLDNEVNSVDWSTMIQILRVTGVIK